MAARAPRKNRTPATTTTPQLLLAVAFSLLLISCCCAAPRVPYRDAGPAESEITWLPGFPAGTKFPSRHFGGHVTVDAAHGRRLYYYLVESEGAHPEQDPLVVWFNGGPGCSSFDGWAYEHGPFKLVVPARERGNETTAAPPRLVLNPFSWAKAANMLYLDAPAGVGFSYSDVAADYETVDDTRTAKDNLAFLVRWLEVYEGRFGRSEVYVAGESYAGVYVPTLVEAIHAHNAQVKKEEAQQQEELLLQEEEEEASAPADAGDGESSKKNKMKTRPPGKGNNNKQKKKKNGAKTRGIPKKKAINLKGYLLGNPSTDDTVDQNGLVPFMRAMALISETQFQAAESKCNHSYMPPWSDACYDLLLELDSITADINIYNTLEPCWHDPTPVAPASGSASLPASMHHLGASAGRSGVTVRKRMFGRAWPHRTGLPDGPVAPWPRLLAQTKSTTTTTTAAAADPVRPPHPPYTSHRRAVTCTDDLLAASFLNAPGVRDALRAGPVRPDTGPWALCTDLLNYTHNTGSMLPRHRDAATRWGLRALIYSGDHDFCVPYTGTQAWVRGLGFPLLHDWQPWYVDDQVAGYSAKYAPDLTFATVLGSGHTVPEYKPAQALAMFQRWLKGDKL